MDGRSFGIVVCEVPASHDVAAHDALHQCKFPSRPASLARHRVSLLAPEVRKVVQWVPGRCVAETALRIAECWNIADGVDRRAPFRRERSRDDGVYQPVRFGGAGLWRLRSQMSVWCTLTMAVRRVCFPAFGPCRCCDASGHASQRRWSMEIMAWMQRSYAMLVQRCWMRRVCSWWCWEDNLRP
jgi:hypothetical protein